MQQQQLTCNYFSGIEFQKVFVHSKNAADECHLFQALFPIVKMRQANNGKWILIMLLTQVGDQVCNKTISIYLIAATNMQGIYIGGLE